MCKKMKNLNKILLVILIGYHASIEANSNLEAEDGIVKLFGFEIDVKKPVSISKPPREDDTSVYFKNNKNNEFIVVQLFSDMEAEFWLYNSALKQKPKKIQVETGRHAKVSWQGDHIIEISWGGMGYSITKYIDAKNLKHRTTVDDLLLYDNNSNIYVSFYRDGVEIGHVLNSECETKKIDLDLEYKYVSDAIMSIENVNIINETVSVKYLAKDGVIKNKSILINKCIKQ